MIIKTNKNEFTDFLSDASNYSGDCSAVHFPESVEEIRSLILEANANGTPVTISGNGTGLTGARVPQGGIILSVQRMNKITEINTAGGYAILEPGVLLSDFTKALEPLGFFYPPDPTEQNSFVTANAATNASGAKSFGYGATRQFVLGMDVILPDGNSISLERGKLFATDLQLALTSEEHTTYEIKLPAVQMPKVKNAAGYYIAPGMDAIDLFIGTEGTLGVITSIRVKILPVPEKMLSCVAFFPNELAGLHFIDEARALTRQQHTTATVMHARSLEYFDNDSLAFLTPKFPQIPSNAGSAVWFEQEMTNDTEDAIVECWMELISKHNGLDDDVWYASSGKELENIHNFRHSISTMVNEYISRLGLKKLGTDTAVPDSAFHEFYFWCKDLVRSHQIASVAYGHFGDSHVHLNMLPKNEEEFQLGKKLYADICKKAVSLGGTISAEHGVGKVKREMFKMMYSPEEISGMADIKKVLDPRYILNRGNIFDKSLFKDSHVL